MRYAKPILRTHDVWKKITRLSGTSGRHFVAVPYIGSGASKLLRLKSRDHLVVRFDHASVRSGQVNPYEIAKFIKRGVRVHACANLHAKVFVFGDTTLIGSSNVSQNSAKSLIEACAEIRSIRFADSTRQFIRSLCGDEIQIEYVKKLTRHFRPPAIKGGKAKRVTRRLTLQPKHSTLWFVALAIRDFESDKEKKELEKCRRQARKALGVNSKSCTEEFFWDRPDQVYRAKVGDRILMSTKEDGRGTFVSPPGRVISVRRYRDRGFKQAVFSLEMPDGKRRRNLRVLRKSLKSFSCTLGSVSRTRLLRDARLVHAIDQVFFGRKN